MIYYRDWNYRGHRCTIRKINEPDRITYFADVTTPRGVERAPDIGNSLSGREDAIELWIDAGMPSRPVGQSGPLTLEQLRTLATTRWRFKNIIRTILKGFKRRS